MKSWKKKPVKYQMPLHVLKQLPFLQKSLKITTLPIHSFSSHLNEAHRSPWLPYDPETVLASERAFPNSALGQAPHQRHGGWDVDCEHGGYGTSLLLLAPSACLTLHWERGSSFRSSCVQGLVFPILCAVMGSSSSLGCHKRSPPT